MLTESIMLISKHAEINFEKSWECTKKLHTGWCFDALKEPRVKGGHVSRIHPSLLI